jgi:hypothetical protein
VALVPGVLCTDAVPGVVGGTGGALFADLYSMGDVTVDWLHQHMVALM